LNRNIVVTTAIAWKRNQERSVGCSMPGMNCPTPAISVVTLKLHSGIGEKGCDGIVAIQVLIEENAEVIGALNSHGF